MKKTGQVLFIALFLLLCLLPSVAMIFTGPSEAAANEILAQPPELQDESGAFNLEYLNDCSNYLADRFAGRQELITLNAEMESAIFGESASKDVILGKDGWLFYRTTLDDYQGTNLLSEREIWAAAHSMKLVEETAEKRDITFLFTVVPNKNTLYPEHMPASCVRSDSPGNLEHLETALDAEGVSYLSLKDVFEHQEQELYHKMDSHWTNLGAALAHDAIVKALGEEKECFYKPECFIQRMDHKADLYQMLYPAGDKADEQFYPDWQLRFTYDRPLRSVEDQRIDTSCEGADGSLFMFRDSFGNTLHAFMAESFAKACFSRAMPYQIPMLDQTDADTLVIEIVERNIPWLTQRAPIMEAPTREMTLPTKETNCKVSVNEVESENDFFCYTGNIGEKIDEDSPIYLICDGVVYEASPAGDGSQPFTAYLDQSAQMIHLAWKQNGNYILTQGFPCK